MNEEETIKDCVDITTEYLRENLTPEGICKCDICGKELFYRYLVEPSKLYARRTKVGEVYIGWHRYCMWTEMARIWKEIFQAQKLKRKKEPLTSKNITAMMEM